MFACSFCKDILSPVLRNFGGDWIMRMQHTRIPALEIDKSIASQFEPTKPALLGHAPEITMYQSSFVWVPSGEQHQLGGSRHRVRDRKCRASACSQQHCCTCGTVDSTQGQAGRQGAAEADQENAAGERGTHRILKPHYVTVLLQFSSHQRFSR